MRTQIELLLEKRLEELNADEIAILAEYLANL